VPWALVVDGIPSNCFGSGSAAAAAAAADVGFVKLMLAAAVGPDIARVALADAFRGCHGGWYYQHCTNRA
jgi:hypothetical protein